MILACQHEGDHVRGQMDTFLPRNVPTNHIWPGGAVTIAGVGWHAVAKPPVRISWPGFVFRGHRSRLHSGLNFPNVEQHVICRERKGSLLSVFPGVDAIIASPHSSLWRRTPECHCKLIVDIRSRARELKVELADRPPTAQPQMSHLHCSRNGQSGYTDEFDSDVHGRRSARS
jgi:hypothetical protein